MTFGGFVTWKERKLGPAQEDEMEATAVSGDGEEEMEKMREDLGINQSRMKWTD